jgi:hypothetical protein
MIKLLPLKPLDPFNRLADKSKDLRDKSPVKHDKILSSLNRLKLRSRTFSFVSFDDRTSKPGRETSKQDN